LLAFAQILQFLTLFMFVKIANYPKIISKFLQAQGLLTVDFLA